MGTSQHGPDPGDASSTDLLRRAEAVHIKVRANFPGIIEHMRFKARKKVKRSCVQRQIRILVLPDGDLLIE
jgi:transcriptional regulator